MIIALASPGVASTLNEGLDKIKRFLSDASAQGAEIGVSRKSISRVCGDRILTYGPLIRRSRNGHSRPWRSGHARMRWPRPRMERLPEAGRQIVAWVIDARGQLQGYQTKNQLDPTEDQFYVPDHTQRLFEINGMTFGVVICHEGWRYPETVRWAAARDEHTLPSYTLGKGRQKLWWRRQLRPRIHSGKRVRA